MNVGYGYDHSQSRVDYGLQGGILVHENGVTLSQPLSETMALVKAPCGRREHCQQHRRENRLARLCSRALRHGIPTQPDCTRHVYLTRQRGYDADQYLGDPNPGAVVRADFDPNVGQRVLMTLTRVNGEPVPFGATAGSDGKNSGASIVGDGGQVYLSGMDDSGTLTVKWGSTADQTCRVNYRLPEQTATSGIQLMNGDCR